MLEAPDSSNRNTRDDAAMSEAGLVLVLSPERSGSTLLAAMLGANERILAPPELFLLRYPDYDAWRKGKPEAFPSLAWLLQRLEESSTPSSVDERFHGVPMHDFYHWILGRIGPGRFLVDKTPAYARDPKILARVEGLTPRYVWLVRHPLGVANSWLERRRRRRWSAAGRVGTASAAWLARSQRPGARWLGARLDDAAVSAGLRRWCLVHGNIERFASTLPAERVRRVHYEDLVSEPERSLQSLSEWVGVPFDAAMLEPWKHLPDTLARGTGDELIRKHESLRSDRAHSWRGNLGEHRLDQHTRDLMERLGVAG